MFELKDCFLSLVAVPRGRLVWPEGPSLQKRAQPHCFAKGLLLHLAPLHTFTQRDSLCCLQTSSRAWQCKLVVVLMSQSGCLQKMCRTQITVELAAWKACVSRRIWGPALLTHR